MSDKKKVMTKEEAMGMACKIAAQLEEKTGDSNQMVMIINTVAGFLFNHTARLKFGD